MKKRSEPHPLDVPPFLRRKGDGKTPEQRRAEWQAAADEYRAAHPEQFKQAEKPRPILDLPTEGTTMKEKTSMATKVKKTKEKAAPKAPAEPGYKGHKKGSKLEALHKAFDEKGEDAARKVGEKLGLASATLTIQFSKYRNEGGAKKAKKAKPETKAKAKPAKSGKAKNSHAEIVA